MKQITLFALTLVMGGASLFAADPQLLNLATPGAQMYAGVNVTQAKTSQFGQFLLGQFPETADFQEFITATGFDPRRDLAEVLVSGTAPTPAQADAAPTPVSGLFLAKGTFNLPQILAGAAADARVKVTTYSGVSIVTIVEGDHNPSLALLDTNTIAASDLPSVKAAIDRRGTTNIIDPAIMARINELSASEDAWSVSTANIGSFLTLPGSNGSSSTVLQGITQASAGVKFGAANSVNVQVNAQAVAKDATDAGSLRDVIKLLAQMVEMHGQNGATSPVTALLQNLVVSTDGNIVNVSLSVPESQLETLLTHAHGMAAKGASKI